MLMNPKILEKCHAKIRRWQFSNLCFWSKSDVVKSREGFGRQEKIERVYHQGWDNCTHHSNIRAITGMPDWYYGTYTSSCGNCKHAWRIHKNRHGRWDGAHENGGENGWDTHQVIPQAVTKIHPNRKRKIRPICWVLKGTVRPPSGGPAILAEPDLYLAGVGIWNKPIRLVRGQQKS